MHLLEGKGIDVRPRVEYHLEGIDDTRRSYPLLAPGEIAGLPPGVPSYRSTNKFELRLTGWTGRNTAILAVCTGRMPVLRTQAARQAKGN